jgi:peptidoglycan/LPS O-acetylase OafA/YrhL
VIIASADQPEPVSSDTASGTRPRAERLSFVDGVRGLAALWVVLFHASAGGHIESLKAALPGQLVRLLFEFGYLGVSVFFVVSGFVMMHSVRELPVTPDVGRRFMLRRLLRLTPPYYASIAFIIAYGALKARLSGQAPDMPSFATLAAHAFYLQDILSLPPISTVYWTLCIEIQFYLVFAGLMLAQHWLSLRLGAGKATVLVLAASALVGLPWGLGILQTPLYAGGFITFWYCFVVGMLMSAQTQIRSARWMFAAYVAMLAIAAVTTGAAFTIAALAGAALIYAGLRVSAVERFLSAGPLLFLGLVSYSLYLIHNQVAGATAFAIRRVGGVGIGVASELVLLLAMVGACLLAAYVGYRWVEKPSIDLSRRVSLRPSRRAAAAASSCA